MAGNKQFGWLEEATEGTSAIAADSTVINFGIEDEFDRPHPWGEQEIMGILSEGAKAPTDLVAGMKNVKIKHQFIYQHGWEWYYLLGKKTHINADEDDFTLGTLAANPIKSRTVYSRVGTDYVKATGCKTKSFAIHLESPIPGQKPRPIWCDLELWGWTTSTSLALNNAPTFPATMDDADATLPLSKGVEKMSLLTLEGTSLANIQEITIGGINTLQYHGGVLSTTPRGIEQLEGTKIFIEGLATMDFTANDALADARTNFTSGFTPGTNHSFVFKIKFSADGSHYHEIDLENVFIHSLKPVVYRNKIESYTFIGECMKYGSTEPITVKCIDDIDYIAA